MRDNVRRMRQISRASRKREEESKQPVKAMWKSGKYEGVTSKVKQELEVCKAVRLYSHFHSFAV